MRECLRLTSLRIRHSEAGEEEIHQTEIQVVVERFSLAELQPSRLKHPAYTNLLSKETPSLSSSSPSLSADAEHVNTEDEDLTEAPYMRLKYIQHQEPRKTRQSSVYYSTKEVNLQFNGVQLVFDRDVWKRLHSFFTEGPRAKLLEKAVEEGLDAVVESMLYDYVKFKVEAVGCSVVLPPFAGHKGPHHIASIVLLIHADRCLLPPSSPITPLPPRTGALRSLIASLDLVDAWGYTWAETG
jgi:hypothetical protein